MKIMIVSCAYPPYIKGGVSKLLSELTAEVLNKGHDIYVFALMDDPSKRKYSTRIREINGIKTKFINIPYSSLTYFWARYYKDDYFNPYVAMIFKSYLNKISPDVVHFHSIQSLGANLITEAHKSGYPTVLTMHDWWWFCPNLFLLDLDLNICDQKTVELDRCKDCLKALTDIYPNIDVGSYLEQRNSYLKSILRNDVDIILSVSQTLKRFVEANIDLNVLLNENGINKPSKIRDKNINTEKVIFGFFGGRSDFKGYNILIDSFNSINLSNWELHIHGLEKPDKISVLRNIKNKTFRKSFLRYLDTKLAKSNENDNIKYFTYMPGSKMEYIISQIDVIVVPSIMRESFSLITREALILKKPIICSNCGGPEEIVTHNINGLIFKAGDTNDLREQITKILLNPNVLDMFKSNINTDEIKLISDQGKELEYLYTAVISRSDSGKSV